MKTLPTRLCIFPTVIVNNWMPRYPFYHASFVWLCWTWDVWLLSEQLKEHKNGSINEKSEPFRLFSPCVARTEINLPDGFLKAVYGRRACHAAAGMVTRSDIKARRTHGSRSNDG